MTSEIAILNKTAVALAADSAVTVFGQKVYNGANKLFALSKHEPVGIMIYDNVDMMGVPWEILIKEYRRELGSKSFEKLKDYANSFWEFLVSNQTLLPHFNEKDFIRRQVVGYLLVLQNALAEKVKEILERKDSEMTVEETYQLFRTTVFHYGKLIAKLDYLDGFDSTHAVGTLEANSSEFSEIAKEAFEELSDLFDDAFLSVLNVQISNLFVRDYWGSMKTGIVLAGYGRQDVFPRIASFQAEGTIQGRLRLKFLKEKSNIDERNFATTIVPFAQDEMVWTFMGGIDPDVDRFSNKRLAELFGRMPQWMSEVAQGVEPEVMRQMQVRLVQENMKTLDEYKVDSSKERRENITDPILDMVSGLPKDDLASMAESLVNLTVFKRKVSSTMETVGGPIDVAVISKGDGFIWAKRKHYFKPELNPQFFANYFRGERSDA